MEEILKRKNIRIPVKASVWYVAMGVITKAIGFLITPIFTRILSGEEYGAYSLYMSYLGLFSVICTAGFSAGVIYRGFQKYSDRKDAFLSASLGFTLCFSGVICILLFTFSKVLGLRPEFSLILCVQLIADSAIGLSLMKKRYYYKYKTVVRVGIFEAVGAPLISLSLLYGANLGFVAKLWGLLIPAILAAAGLVIGIIRKSHSFFDKEIWRYLLFRSIPLFPSVVSGAVSSNIASFVFAKSLGNDSLAKYSITHSVSVGLLFVVSALSASLAPWITRKLAAEKRETVSKIASVLFTMLGGATLILIGIVPEAVTFLAPSEYGEAISAALPIALAALPSFVTSISATALVFSNKGGRVSLSAILGAVSNLLLCLALIPTLKYFGAGMALLLSNLVSSAASLCFLNRVKLGDTVNIRRISFVFLITAAYGVLISLLYNYAALRILLLFVPVIVAVRALLSVKELIQEK